MKNLYVLLLTFLFAAVSWATELAEHPASMAANVPTFLPADFFAQSQAEMAVDEPAHQHGESAPQQSEPEAQSAHDHDHAAAAEEVTPESKVAADGKGCKRGEGCCCCCKCCKGEEETKASDMQGCKMMKKGGMMMDKGKSSTTKKSVAKPAAKKEDAHEAHH